MLKTVEKVLLLQDLEEFRLASTEHLAKLAVVTRERREAPGTYLFRKGGASSELCLLVQGKVSLEFASGEFRTVETCSLDLFSVFSQSGHAVSARTLEPCVLLVVDYDDLVDLLESEAEFSSAMARYLARKARELTIALQSEVRA